MSLETRPHDIRLSDGSPAYHCRNCHKDSDLRWFNDTSCPVCLDPACAEALNAEYNSIDEDDTL